MARRALSHGSDEPSLAWLIERCAELKRALVDFALSPRMERHLERFMVEGAGSREVLIEDETIEAIDRFTLLYRLPNGKTVLDQFLASWPDLGAGICGRRRSARSRFAAWPPPTPRRSTPYSGRSCASRISPGPSTARPCCAGVSPGTTSTSPVLTAL